MGGDKSPSEIVDGARRVVADDGIPVVLVGPPDQVGDTLGLPLVACTEVIAMDEDPAGGVRRKKDSSLVRAAELVRDGQASAMVSAGNTGATMAAALLRMGRLPGVVRPCIATPLPRLGRTPAVLVDAGANAECTPTMLVQFAQMGCRLRRRPLRDHRAHGRPALDRRGADQGHAAGQGDPLAAGARDGVRLRRQPRGAGPAAVAGRRHRDRRVHRQRRPQGARGVAPLPVRHVLREVMATTRRR